MAIELVQSGFRPSFDVPNLEVECTWNAYGKTFHTLTLASAENMADPRWWRNIEFDIETRLFMRALHDGEVVSQVPSSSTARRSESKDTTK